MEGTFSGLMSAAEMEEMAPKIEYLSNEVWVDGDGYQRRILSELRIEDDAQVRIDVRFWDFDQEILIPQPGGQTS